MGDNTWSTSGTQTLATVEGDRSLSELYLATLGKRRRVSLLIYHREGAELIPLDHERPVVVGRTRDADIKIRDASLSRRHARFELINGQAWVEDLGSTNGTLVNGEKVDRSEITSIDQVTLGSLPVMLNNLDPAEEGLYGLEGHDLFRAALNEEIYRARLYGRQVTLLMVADAGAQPRLSHRWCPDVRRLLRPFDRAGLYGPAWMELLVPEAGQEEVEGFTARIRSIGAAAGVDLLVGAACYPLCGTSAEELIEAARIACRGADQAPVHVRWAPVRTAHAAETPPAVQGAAAEVDADADGPVLRSPRMQRVFDLAQQVASKSVPVLVRGETGSGKEVVARAIHERSGRKGKLRCVNCGALPSQLVVSTLFGHEKGAFTGASQRTEGVFEAARSGTILLDEIGELPLEAQVALLRVLETRRITRVGSTREIAVDARVLAATHRDVEAMVREGTFREDLFFRLNVICIDVPPLRERSDEITPLAYRFIQQANRSNGCQISGISEEALARLREHAWPGNVRELRNVIERAVVISHGSTITVDDLPAQIRETPPAAALAPAEMLPNIGGEDLKTLVAGYEARLIEQALEQVGWDRRAAADLLGLPLRTFARKMSQYGIKVRGR